MNSDYWNKAKVFHGHECPGLAIGVKACQAAVEIMGINPAIDEELVCITENDACGVDAVQALLGCTLGKGNLIYKATGKQAFTFINRSTGKAVRFCLKTQNNYMERSLYQEYILNADVCDLFEYKIAEITIPDSARSFSSIVCEKCGESTSENKIRLQEGKSVCLDCYDNYSRGWYISGIHLTL